MKGLLGALVTFSLAMSPASARAPDIERGRQIAVQGATAGAQPCAACHGADGAGDSSGAFPRLSGQGAFYLYKQLKDFQSGSRGSAVMTPIARALSDTDMQDVSGYFAATQGRYFEPPSADGETLQRGGMLSATGSTQKNVPACSLCHGWAGRGMPPSFPFLAGQFAPYLKIQLNAWKTGARRNDPLDVMRDIAGRLDDRDIDAVARYFASVRPSAPP